MQKKATLWTMQDCPNCEKEKKILLAEGYEVRVRDCGAGDWKGLANDPDRDDVMAQLQVQDGAFPVVRIEGKFRRPRLLANVHPLGE